MSKNNFYEKIKSAVIERQVEDCYNESINLYFPGVNIEYPFSCDGFVDTNTDNGKILKLIIEYKFNEALVNSVARAKVLVQVIYYIKRFENEGLMLPNVCMVGDKDECFVMHTNELLKYLDEDVDWSITPSTAAENNPDLVLKISKDEAINPFVFVVDEAFDFKAVSDKIKDLADGVKRYVRVTEHNIAKIFDCFVNYVIKDSKKMSPNDTVAVFMGVIADRDRYYKHPAKQNTLVTPSGEVFIDGKGFDSFFSYFDRTYTPQEKMRFTEISDRLIEDTKRRNDGAFFTPTLFVDKAHRMIEEALGEDWKEKYVVYDMCCGTKNLTRDYKFKELYCSTLEQSELDMSERYNKEAVSFQFDFLNDYIPMPSELVHMETKIPDGLLKALREDKPIVFFLNPPYATSGNWQGEKKTDVAKTMINAKMKEDKIGACCQNLYAQFLYRIIMIKREFNLTNCHIALYSPTLFLTGSSWAKFRNAYLNEFAFDNAVQFKSSHFADCADSWGISFSLWHNGETVDKNNFNYTLIDCAEGEIVECGEKVVYNIDGKQSGNDWAKQPIKGIKTFETISLKSAVTTRENGKIRGRNFNGSLGYIFISGNNVDTNTQNVSLFSASYAKGDGCGINTDNFDRCTALFAARKLIEKNWVNSKDEYLAPNTEHTAYNEFVNDSLIYSLFHSSSNQSSLRNVEYKGRLWNIKNEFFWMSKEEMMQLAASNNNDYCYHDARTDTERYVYKRLQETSLSTEARSVLDKAKEIVSKTFKYREMFNEEHPEYHINTWDAGWYQVKAVCKEYTKKDYEEFQRLFKALSDKMRPMVYVFGFLK